MIDFLFLFPPAALTVDLQHVRSKQQLGFGLAKMLLCASVRQRKKTSYHDSRVAPIQFAPYSFLQKWKSHICFVPSSRSGAPGWITRCRGRAILLTHACLLLPKVKIRVRSSKTAPMSSFLSCLSNNRRSRPTKGTRGGRSKGARMRHWGRSSYSSSVCNSYSVNRIIFNKRTFSFCLWMLTFKIR